MTPSMPGQQQAPMQAAEYRSSSSLATIVAVLLGIVAIVGIAFIIVLYLHYSFISFNTQEHIETGQTVFLGGAVDTEARQWVGNLAFGIKLLTGVLLLSVTVTGVVFLLWLYRVYSNLPAIDGQPRKFALFWTIVAWLIPLVNLVLPMFIVLEVWQRSYQPEKETRSRKPPNAMIFWWWGLLILSELFFMGGASLRMLNRFREHGDRLRLLRFDWMSITSMIIMLFAIILMAGIMTRISSDQDTKMANKSKA